ncbi:Druantia anti-phage system protein DruA [Stenotrophomonas lacuserhaii]|uniref:Druantia anti-phage system protein DruA n=1 Tax=Stenotrophomonas lacuserhaii TaxID=2760084 RepID=UPI001C730E55|nr:Druantia anti-phage system protein DruA [Stenotrophomonas lacuserhaii]
MSERAVVQVPTNALAAQLQNPSGAPRTADELRDCIEGAWNRSQTAVQSGDKDALRRLHLDAKLYDGSVNYEELRRNLRTYKGYFPSGAKINPEKIRPIVLPVVSRSLEERLFRTLRGYWSMPYSKGYGRRLRFVVMDAHHEAIIGIIGLHSPSADLACRDNYLGISKPQKLAIVNNTLDAFTIGASPTYAPLLGGKLVAGLLHSEVIRQEYWRQYGGEISPPFSGPKPQPLLAITTASAFGRSSIYSRLRFHGRSLAKPLGYTKGFGTLHLEAVYPEIVAWLRRTGRFVPAGFGNGPKVRWQNVVKVLADLKIPRSYLEHGIQREIYIFELVKNLQGICKDGQSPEVADFDAGSWGDYWKERWCLPRVARTPDWYEFDPYARMNSALGV